MKLLYSLIVISLFACTENEQQHTSLSNSDTVTAPSASENNNADSTFKRQKQADTSKQRKGYSNARFKEVTVQKVGADKYTVQGKAQVFEATFSWVVEDGHNELKKGHQMTDAGAPAWGNFNFTVEVQKERPNSTLILILFEASPKDGSRQYELPIALE
ncbi:sporulation protein [Ilyomonas limi]|uniref:Sporulation protein n=1 Tax=Ilyomonas limi TaxID=2575867 RepID=A0A4U3KYT2_9BACT|nr:Gmad2 immunoglobulin-like domain-containing protein [Ilyomonas limi]TKK67670.1 sporulation protein [Ilyomonas limi]